MQFQGSHLLSVNQFERGDIARIFRLANEIDALTHQKKVNRVLDGMILGNLFFEPSTRTRVSFSTAFNRLGGTVSDTIGFQFSSIAKGESIYDTSRVLSAYLNIFVVRHPVEGAVHEFAKAATVPVINGGDGIGEHPTQALLDLYTIYKELGRGFDELEGTKVAMVGDLKYGRAVHSLTRLLGLLRHVEFVFVAPEGLQIPDAVLNQVRDQGHVIHQTSDLIEGISNVDVVYMTRLQQERFATPEECAAYRGRFSLNRQLYETHCKPGTILMHPLPRDSSPETNELDTDLDGHPHLAIFRQVHNGVPIRMALFALVLGVEDQLGITPHRRDVWQPLSSEWQPMTTSDMADDPVVAGLSPVARQLSGSDGNMSWPPQ